MESDGIITKGKFSYVGEILPNNERSNAIIAQRREEEQRRKEEAERVSRDTIYFTSKSNMSSRQLRCLLNFINELRLTV